jgi:hypothetical protein
MTTCRVDTTSLKSGLRGAIKTEAVLIKYEGLLGCYTVLSEGFSTCLRIPLPSCSKVSNTIFRNVSNRTASHPIRL